MTRHPEVFIPGAAISVRQSATSPRLCVQREPKYRRLSPQSTIPNMKASARRQEYV